MTAGRVVAAVEQRGSEGVVVVVVAVVRSLLLVWPVRASFASSAALRAPRTANAAPHLPAAERLSCACPA